MLNLKKILLVALMFCFSTLSSFAAGDSFIDKSMQAFKNTANTIYTAMVDAKNNIQTKLTQAKKDASSVTSQLK